MCSGAGRNVRRDRAQDQRRSACGANHAGIKDTLAERGAYVHPVAPREAQAFVRSQQELWKPALDHIALQFKER